MFCLVGLGAVLTPLLPLFERLGIVRARVAAFWFRCLLRVLGIRVEVSGSPAPLPVLVAANHISWVDILLIGWHSQAAFVSKSEVREWPLIGWFAREVGTVFLPRGGHQTRLCNDAILGRLHGGQSVALFPEGTTTDRRLPKPFHARLFAAAVEARHPVQPVALRYLPPPGSADEQHPAAPYINEIGFTEHLFGLLAARDLRVELIYCPVIQVSDHDRRAIAHAAWQAVTAALGGEPVVARTAGSAGQAAPLAGI